MIPRLLALIAVVLLSVVASVRVEFTTDTTAILPSRSALRATLAAAEEIAGASTLLVELDGTGTDRATLAAETRALAEVLRGLPAVASVRAGVASTDAADVRSRVTPHAAAWLDPADLAARATPEAIEATLARQRARLATPTGVFFAGAIRQDPLNLIADATTVLGAEGFPGVRIADGLLLDRDGTHALLLVTTAISPSDVVPDDPHVKQLEAALAACPLPTRWHGGVRVAFETATGIARDVQLAGGLGMVLLLIVLVFGFRSWRPIVGAIPPMAVAAGCAGIGAWWASPVHGLQLAFSAALAGLAVDYWVHVYLTAAELPDAPEFWGRVRVGEQAVASLLPALSMSAGSTALAFGLLATSPLPMIQVLGVTGAASAVGALLGSALAGPWVWGLIGRHSPSRPLPAPPRLLAWPLLIGAVVAGLLGPFASYDPDPMALLGTSERAREDEATLAARYDIAPQQGLILVKGADVGEALDRAARAERALDAAGAMARGPAAVLPGPAAAQAARAALPSADELQARLDAASDALGMPRFEGVGAQIVASASAPPADLWVGSALEARVQVAGDKALIAVPLPDLGRVPVYEAALREVDPELELVVPRLLTGAGMDEARDALISRAGIGSIAVFVLLALWHRSPARATLALLPAGAAAACAAGAMAVTGSPWNPVSLATMVPVLGLAVDYGVFMTEGHGGQAPRAVVLSAATTLAGFATLVLANSPALAGVGVATFAGVGGAAMVALGCLPWWAKR